eukprot:1825825-Prymnesium_polylepis.1
MMVSAHSNRGRCQVDNIVTQALRAGEIVTPSSPLTDVRCSRICEDIRPTSALRGTRWLQVGCSVVATRRSSRMTCACAL